MQRFKNILFASDNSGFGLDCLKKALKLAQNNNAKLKILRVFPILPADLTTTKNDFEKYLVEKTNNILQTACKELKINETELNVTIETEDSASPAICIIQNVLRASHDLVIKQAEDSSLLNGFKAVDMELLRKCPCPVWIDRPNKPFKNKINIAVAIDAESAYSSGHDLSIDLLKLGSGLAEMFDGSLDIISCWFYEYEAELSKGGWYEISPEALSKIVGDIKDRYEGEFHKLLQEAKITRQYQTHLIKGKPDIQIPQFVKEHNIDVIVMGTIARTGLQGIFIGNTAENVLRQLECSLLAKKIHGFISPIKA